MEAALERDHRGAAGEAARELDRVLDRLRAGVEERRLRRSGERQSLQQPLRQLDVRLVRDDREVGVGEAGELLLGRGDDLRMRVADVQAADAAREVDERVAVDVGEQARRSRLAATIGNATASGAAITRSLRSRIARERGPGTSVRSSIERVAAMGSR